MKSIDAAKASLAVDQASLHNATLRSPVTGTVAAVGVTKGTAVDAGSSSDTITVAGNGILTVPVSISLADIDKVKVGQHAQVTVDGRAASVPAMVATVGVTNSSSSTGSGSTYQVVVQLSRRYRTLYDGMGASVAIDVGRAANVVTVPISALHTIGSLSTVTVYANGSATTKRVTVGVIGADTAQISSGVSAGDQVVLANIDAAVPSSTTDSSRRGSFGGFTGTGSGPPVGGSGPPGGGPGG